MTIHFSNGAPTNTHKKISGWAKELRSANKARANVPAVIGDAYKVRYLSAVDIASGHLLDAAHCAQWRHLVSHDGHSHGELELDEALQPVALYQGPGNDGLVAAIAQAAELEGDYEAIVLSSPALYFTALWLHNADADLIIPYEPNMTELANYVAVSSVAAMRVLKPLAKQV
jgi:hypothetical protein